MSEQLYTLSLSDALAALHSGATSSESLTRAFLDRIATTEAKVQAWAYLDADAAITAARRSDGERDVGSGSEPLAGVGIGVKDIVATADQPTQLGSPIYADAQPVYDAECVLRLRHAGGFVMGKTVTTEFAFMHAGKTRNPWNAAHTPGGSSSGSAAAVAVGHVPAAIGTQTNGSVIRPAAYCGVVGFKPTVDAIPFTGVNLFSPTLDTLGVFARSVADCALLASCLADPGRIAGKLVAPARPPRLALLEGFPWVATGTEQERAMHAAAAKLRGCGAVVTTVAIPKAWEEAPGVHRLIMLYEAVQQLGELQARERARISPKLNAALDEGKGIVFSAYAAALARRDMLIADATEWLAPFDGILSPPTPAAAPADLTETGDPSCCTLWSLLGFPAASIPVAVADNGLPMGMQLAAIAGSDDRLLEVAHWCEACLPFAGLV